MGRPLRYDPHPPAVGGPLHVCLFFLYSDKTTKALPSSYQAVAYRNSWRSKNTRFHWEECGAHLLAVGVSWNHYALRQPGWCVCVCVDPIPQPQPEQVPHPSRYLR